MLHVKEIGISSARLGLKLAQNFVPLNSPMMQFHITSTQSPGKLKIVNRRHLVRLMNAKALGIVQRDR